MAQVARRLTDAVDGFLASHRFLICDRDSKWSDAFRHIVQDAGVRIVLTPIQAPNANAYAERFVRSIREEQPEHGRSFRTLRGREPPIRVSARHQPPYGLRHRDSSW